jgi:hypothetical protein
MQSVAVEQESVVERDVVCGRHAEACCAACSLCLPACLHSRLFRW